MATPNIEYQSVRLLNIQQEPRVTPSGDYRKSESYLRGQSQEPKDRRWRHTAHAHSLSTAAEPPIVSLETSEDIRARSENGVSMKLYKVEGSNYKRKQKK
jgi:hypothetical protein